MPTKAEHGPGGVTNGQQGAGKANGNEQQQHEKEEKEEEATMPAARRAWATLVTGDKYLPGVAVFAESLLRQPSSSHNGSQYPLVAMVTSDVSAEAIKALIGLGCVIRPVKKLHPGHLRGAEKMAFAHFGNVWTKLRAFGLSEYERVIMVDSDMLVRQNMDELMEMELDEGHIMATFACTCNPSKRPNYPKEWTPDNCAYTPQRHPDHSLHGMTISPSSPPTHHLLNSGLVVLTPSLDLMSDMEWHVQHDQAVEHYRFPDQDFLGDYFKNRFRPLPWVYNALKKLRSSHSHLWRDEEAKNVHYILDKPWAGRLDGNHSDAVTHQWWWDAYHTRSWPAIVTAHVHDCALSSTKATGESIDSRSRQDSLFASLSLYSCIHHSAKGI